MKESDLIQPKEAQELAAFLFVAQRAGPQFALADASCRL